MWRKKRQQLNPVSFGIMDICGHGKKSLDRKTVYAAVPMKKCEGADCSKNKASRHYRTAMDEL